MAKKKSKQVILTTGHKVPMVGRDWRFYLYRDVIEEVVTNLLQDKELKRSDRFWHAVNDTCTCELYYVAGQLKQLGSRVTIPRIMQEFEIVWDEFAEQWNNGEPQEEPKKAAKKK